MSTVSTEAANFSWLLDNFVKNVPDVRHTLVVSADGLLMAMSDELDRTSGDQMSAIVAGMSSLTRGAARQLRAGEVRQAISVVKKRGGNHERTIRELQMDSNGLHVGEPLREFRGVLTGVPMYEREAASVTGDDDSALLNGRTRP